MSVRDFFKKKDEITALKDKIRPKYLAYRSAMNNYPADCGKSMVYQLRPDLEQLKNEINAMFDQLALIDPDCPKSRL